MRVNTEAAEGEDEAMTNNINWPLDKTPIIRFVNKQDNYSTIGRSEIRPAIPLQDALNRTLHSMVSASEFSAFSIKYSIGIPIDPVNVTPGGVINLLVTDQNDEAILSDEAAKFLSAVKVGQFEASPMKEYIDQVIQLVKEISQVTSTPIYGVTSSGVLSGEAMKQLEIGLVTKCHRFQRANTDAIKELVVLTQEIQNNFLVRDEDELISEAPAEELELRDVVVAWKPPELVDEVAAIATLLNLRKEAPGLFSDTFYRNMVGNLIHISEAELKEDGRRIESDPSETEKQQSSGGSPGRSTTAVPGDRTMSGVAIQRSDGGDNTGR
jgi:hypothetical protein